MEKCEYCCEELTEELDAIFQEYYSIFMEPCFCKELELIRDLKNKIKELESENKELMKSIV